MLFYIKEVPRKGLLYRKHGHLNVEKSTSGYCIYVGGNVITWYNKKLNVVSYSSAEAEYRFMVQTACEMV